MNRYGADKLEVRLTVKPVARLGTEERAELRSLTVDHHDSAMRKILNEGMDSLAIVARRGGDVVGWATITPIAALRPNDPTNKVFVLGVYVRSDQRRSGIGKILGQRAAVEARGIRSDAIVVAGARLDTEDEESGMALYRSIGFTEESGVTEAGGQRTRRFHKRWR